MAMFEGKFKKLKAEEDKRKNNGGSRKGAGRPLSPSNQAMLDHMDEEIVVKEYSHGQIRRVKKKRLIILLDHLFIMGVRDKNIPAMRAYLDLTRGKSVIYKRSERKPSPKQIYCPALALAHAEYLKFKD